MWYNNYHIGIELTTYVNLKKLLYDEDFIIPYVTGTIPNLPAVHQLSIQDNKNVWIIDINGEEPITAQVALDELNHHKNPHGKSNVKIIICRRKSYHRTDLENICSVFDQFRPLVSHLEIPLPEKPPTPNNNGGSLKGP